MRKWQLAALVGGAVAVQALAQPGPGGSEGGSPPRPPETRADAQAMVREQFARFDRNGDGAISREEYDAARDAMQAQRDGGAGDGAAPARPRGSGGMGMGMGGGHWFDRVDADHDGRVTLAEAQAAAMQVFDMVDSNHDGVVSPDERRTAMAMMRALRGGRHGGEGGGSDQ